MEDSQELRFDDLVEDVWTGPILDELDDLAILANEVMGARLRARRGEVVHRAARRWRIRDVDDDTVDRLA